MTSPFLREAKPRTPDKPGFPDLLYPVLGDLPGARYAIQRVQNFGSELHLTVCNPEGEVFAIYARRTGGLFAALQRAVVDAPSRGDGQNLLVGATLVIRPPGRPPGPRPLPDAGPQFVVEFTR